MEVLFSKLEEIVDGGKKEKIIIWVRKESDGRGDIFEGERDKRYEEK